MTIEQIQTQITAQGDTKMTIEDDTTEDHDKILPDNL